jgi:predicted MFS family arabinose efflux permease
MDQTTTTVAPGGPATKTRSSRTIMLSLLLAAVTCQLVISLETPALPNIASSLHTTTAVIGSAQATFYLAGALLAVILSAYSDFTNTRRLMMWALVLALGGAVIAAVAPSVPVFFVGRVLQSTATAVFPLALRVMRQTLTTKQFGQAMGWITAANGGVVGLDGILSGWLVDHYGFRSVFGVMIIFAVVTLIVLGRNMPHIAPVPGGRMDWWGLVLLVLSIAGLELGFGTVSSAGPVMMITVVGAGVLLFVVFCLVERKRPYPLIPVEYLRSRAAWPILIVSLLACTGILGPINYIIPVFSQTKGIGYGMTAVLYAVMYIVPVCLVNVLFAPLVGTWAPKFGWRVTMRVSMLFSVPILVILGFGLHSVWLTFVMLGVLGFGFAGALTPLNGLSAINADPRNPTVLAGVNSAAYGVGSSLGILIAAQVTATAFTGHSAAPFQDAIWIDAAIIAAGFVFSLFVTGRSGHTDERI